MTILLMNQKIEQLPRRRTRISTWVRRTDEQLLWLVRKSIKEERSTARKNRSQIRRSLYHLRIIFRIYLDNTLVRNLHNDLPKLREIRNDLVYLDCSLRLDCLGHFLRIRRNTVLLRQLGCHPLEFG